MKANIETNLNTIVSNIKNNPVDTSDPLSTENSTAVDINKNTNLSDDPSHIVVAGRGTDLIKKLVKKLDERLFGKKIKVTDDDTLSKEAEEKAIKDLTGESNYDKSVESDDINVDATDLTKKELKDTLDNLEKTKEKVIIGKPGPAGKPPLFNARVFGKSEGMKYMESLASIKDIKKDVGSMKEWEELARKAGFGKDEIVMLKEKYQTYEDLPVEVIQATKAFDLQMDQLAFITKYYTGKNITTMSKKEFVNVMLKFQDATEIIEVALGYRGIGGKALRASQRDGLIMKNSEAISEFIDQIDAKNLRPEFQDILNAFANTVDNATRRKLIRKINGFDFLRDSWITNWINGLLTWSGTWQVNMVSTLANTIWDAGIIRPAAGVVGGIRRSANKITGKRGDADGVYIGETFEALNGWLGSTWDMFSVFYKTFRYGGVDQANSIPEVKRIYRESEEYYQTLLSSGKSPVEARKIADADRDKKVAKAFPNKIREKGKTELEGGKIGQTQNTLYKVPGLNQFYTLENFDVNDYGLKNPLAKGWNYLTGLSMQFGSRVLRSQDEIIKFGAYRAELRALAYRHGEILRDELIKKGGKTESEINDIVAQFKQDVVQNPDKYRVIDDKATQKGVTLAFQQQLDGLPAALENTINRSVALKTVMPFVRTPVNLFSEGLQNSPFAFLSKRFWDSYNKGGAAKDVAIAKFGVGSGVFALLTQLNTQGRFTGSGPRDSDKNKKQALFRSGWRPYSFVFKKGEYDKNDLEFYEKLGIPISLSNDGNLYVSYKGFEPLSAIFALAADYSEYVLYGNPDKSDYENLAFALTTSTYEYISSSPFLQSFSGFADAVKGETNIESLFKNFISQSSFKVVDFAIGGLPYPRNFIANLDRWQYETVKDSEGNPILDKDGKEVEYLPTQKEFRSGDSSEFFGIDTGIIDALHYYRSRTPGLSKDMPDRLNLWGESSTYVDPQFRNFFLLGLRSSQSDVKLADKIIMAYDAPIQKPRRSIARNGARVNLNGEQYNYLITQLNNTATINLKYLFDSSEESVTKGNKNYFFEEAIVELTKVKGWENLTLERQQSLFRKLYNEMLDQAEQLVLDKYMTLNTELENKKLDKIQFLPQLK